MDSGASNCGLPSARCWEALAAHAGSARWWRLEIFSETHQRVAHIPDHVKLPSPQSFIAVRLQPWPLGDGDGDDTLWLPLTETDEASTGRDALGDWRDVTDRMAIARLALPLAGSPGATSHCIIISYHGPHKDDHAKKVEAQKETDMVQR